jgi:ketosteroid isomerase-like protein
MMDRKSIQTLIDQGYAARKTGDLEAIMALFHPDCHFELAGSREFTGVVGIRRGHQELRTAMAEFIAAYEFIERTFLSIVIDGERAAIHSRLKMRFVPKDRIVTTDMLDLWKFEGGKVVEFIEFVDTALVNELIR